MVKLIKGNALNFSLAAMFLFFCAAVRCQAAQEEVIMQLESRTASIFRGATQVQTFRVTSEDKPVASHAAATGNVGGKQQMTQAPPHAAKIEGYFIIGRGPTYGKAFAKSLSSIFLNASTYALDRTKCIPEPGVVFRVWHGSEFADVVMCFQCHLMWIIAYNGKGEMVHSTYTAMGGNSHDDLARLAKKAFPKDREIQAL